MNNLERNVFKTLQEHMRLVNSNAKDLVAGIGLWLDKDKEAMKKKVAVIIKIEEKASTLKNKLLMEIAEAHVAFNRTDLVRLILQMDNMESFIGGAAVRLEYLADVLDLEKEDKAAQLLLDLGKLYIEMNDILSRTIDNLDGKIDKVLALCEEIAMIETKLDSIYRELEAHLYTRHDIDIRQIFQLRTLALHIEEACDMIEDIADSIRIIVAGRNFQI